MLALASTDLMYKFRPTLCCQNNTFYIQKGWQRSSLLFSAQSQLVWEQSKRTEGQKWKKKTTACTHMVSVKTHVSLQKENKTYTTDKACGLKDLCKFQVHGQRFLRAHQIHSCVIVLMCIDNAPTAFFTFTVPFYTPSYYSAAFHSLTFVEITKTLSLAFNTFSVRLQFMGVFLYKCEYGGHRWETD